MTRSGLEPDRANRVALNHGVFWRPFLLMLVRAGLNLAFQEWFGEPFRKANNWLIGNCGALFVVWAEKWSGLFWRINV
jgi:hypothetical protein